jgi:hypothetical protein
LLARLAAERVAREEAAADLRLLLSMAAVAGLVHGREAGRRNFEALQNDLLAKLKPEMGKDSPQSAVRSPQSRTKRGRRLGTRDS